MNRFVRTLLIATATIALAVSGFFALTNAGSTEPPPPDPAGAQQLQFEPEPFTAAHGDLESIAFLIDELPRASAEGSIPAALSEFLRQEADQPRLSVLRLVDVTTRRERAGRALAEMNVAGLGLHGRAIVMQAERTCAERRQKCFAEAVQLLKLGRQLEAAGGAMVVHLMGVQLQSMVYASAGRILDQQQLDSASLELLRAELQVDRHGAEHLLRSLQSDHLMLQDAASTAMADAGTTVGSPAAQATHDWLHSWYSHLIPLAGACPPASTRQFTVIRSSASIHVRVKWRKAGENSVR